VPRDISHQSNKGEINGVGESLLEGWISAVVLLFEVDEGMNAATGKE
jgi:hypothetical protein